MHTSGDAQVESKLFPAPTGPPATSPSPAARCSTPPRAPGAPQSRSTSTWCPRGRPVASRSLRWWRGGRVEVSQARTRASNGGRALIRELPLTPPVARTAKAHGQRWRIERLSIQWSRRARRRERGRGHRRREARNLHDVARRRALDGDRRHAAAREQPRDLALLGTSALAVEGDQWVAHAHRAGRHAARAAGGRDGVVWQSRAQQQHRIRTAHRARRPRPTARSTAIRKSVNRPPLRATLPRTAPAQACP